MYGDDCCNNSLKIIYATVNRRKIGDVDIKELASDDIVLNNHEKNMLKEISFCELPMNLLMSLTNSLILLRQILRLERLYQKWLVAIQ